MPHDKKGRLVEVGDFVKVKPYNTAQPIVGRVSFVNPGSETCNARVVFVDHTVPSSYEDPAPFRTRVSVPVREDYTQCSDMELVLKADGSEPADATPPAEPAPTEG